MQKTYPKQLDKGTWMRYVTYSQEQDHYNTVLQTMPFANPEHRIKLLTKSYGSSIEHGDSLDSAMTKLEQDRNQINNFNKQSDDIQAAFVPDEDKSTIKLTEPERVDLQTV